MKCPCCGKAGHYVYNGWCEDCYADRQRDTRERTFSEDVRRHPKGWPFKGQRIRKILPE